VLDGTRNPALFMPTELHTQLLVTAFDADEARRESWRAVYANRFDLDRFGGDFWVDLERAAGPFLRQRDRVAGLVRATARSDAASRGRWREVSDRMQVRLCALAVPALEAARERFGDDFERFLYEAVAPGLRVPELRSRSEVEFMNEGCRLES